MTKSYEGKVALIERFQARTSADIVNKLNKEINAAIADRKMKSRLADCVIALLVLFANPFIR